MSSSSCPQPIDFCVILGDTWEWGIEYVDENDDPIPLTGFDARLQVRQTASASSTPLITLTEGDGLTVDDVAGTIAVQTLTDALPAAGSYVYDLQIFDGANIRRTLVRGTLVAEAEVTEDA